MTYAVVPGGGGGGNVTFEQLKAAAAQASSAVDWNGQQLTAGDGTTPAALATTRQTYFTPYVSVADGVDLPSVVGQNVRLGGTKTAPLASQVPALYWPRDEDKGPFGVFMGIALFNSTWDQTCAWGYNFNLTKPLEPAAGWVIEQNYEANPDENNLEAYLEVRGNPDENKPGFCRPLFCSFRRSTGATIVSSQFGVDTEASADAGSWSVIGRSSDAGHVGGFQIVKVTNDSVRIETKGFAFFFEGDASAQIVAGDGGFGVRDQDAYGGAWRIHFNLAKPTVNGALSLVADPAAKAVLQSLLAAFTAATGIDVLIDGTT